MASNNRNASASTSVAAERSALQEAEPPSVSRQKAGIVTFALSTTNPNPTCYRYKLMIQDQTLSIWLQDCTNQDQWQTKQLAKEDFVHAQVAIPHASLEDYMMIFQQCLDAPEIIGGAIPSRKLVVREAMHHLRELQLTLNVRVLTSVWSIVWSYKFLLHRLPQNPWDRLETLLHSQQDQIIKLENMVQNQQQEIQALKSQMASLPEKNP